MGVTHIDWIQKQRQVGFGARHFANDQHAMHARPQPVQINSLRPLLCVTDDALEQEHAMPTFKSHYTNYNTQPHMLGVDTLIHARKRIDQE